MASSSTREIRIFYSYAHQDQKYRQQLANHLSNLEYLYHLQPWFDRQIKAGDDWKAVLDEKLNTADLIFLLISPDFMASHYCYNKEMARALERHANGEAKVIPIIVRAVHWKGAPFSHIQMLPPGARPIQSWPDPDEAFLNVVEEVEKVIQDLLSNLHQTAREWVVKAYAQNSSQHFEEALLAFEQALRLDPELALDPTFISIYNNQGSMMKEPRSHENIFQAFEQALRLNPQSARAYHGKSDSLYYLKRYEEALQAIAQAIRLNPTLAIAYKDQGNILAELYRHEEALHAFEQAIYLDPACVNAYDGKGWALYNLNRFEEALLAFGQAIHLDPTHTSAYNGKGWIYSCLNRYKEALENFERTIHLNPSHANAHDGKGWALYNLNRYEEALLAFEQTICLDPNQTDAYDGKRDALKALDNLHQNR